MNKSSLKSNGNAEGPDKVNMSLDDIIRLNRKQKQIQGQKLALRKQRFGVRGLLASGRQAGLPLQRGGAANKPFRRCKQGIITGLAARKAALRKGVSPLNRPALHRANLNKHTNRAPAKSAALYQRTRPFVSQRSHALSYAQTQRRLYAQVDTRKAPGHFSNRHFRLYRKWSAPAVKEPQREARQATFLSRRGLKVCTNVKKMVLAQAAQRTQRSQPWRTPLNSSGILTVSIDNPGARTQPEPAHSWLLHPPTLTPPPQNTVPEPERKKPKGVALQFDINSVGKQTAMTLNERFRILKLKRMVAAQQNARGGRFVTVS